MCKSVAAAFFVIMTLASCAYADEVPAPPADTAPADTQPPQAQTGMKSAKPMKMDEPMPTGMAKKGMMKGDVKKDAAKKGAEMEEKMREEEMKETAPPPK